MIQGFDPGGEYYFSLGITAPNVWSAAAHASLVNNAPAGALTTYAISLDGTPGTVDKNLGANFVTFIQSGRAYINSNFSTGGASILLQMFDGATSQVELRVNNTNNLIVTRNGTGNVIGTSSNTLTPGSGWHYFEWVVTINNTTGSVQVWVDNIQWINVTNVNTRASANNQVNLIRYSSISTSGCFWKDMIWLDTATGANTTRLGDIQIPLLFSNAAGPKQDFSNSGGASQTISVQDGIGHTGTWPDGDTTYIFDSVSGHTSDFQHQTLATGTIYARIHASYVRSDAGASSFKQYTNSAGTLHTTAALSVGTSYGYFFDIIEQDPATAAQWVTTGFNNATDGVQIP